MAGRVQAKKRSDWPQREAGEVVERGAGGDDDGVDLVLVHEGAGAVEALLAFGEGDGDGFGAAVGEGGDGGGRVFGAAAGAVGRWA